jgi:hypothetical protein
LGCEGDSFFSSSESSSNSSGTSKGGSTAKFAIKGNTLYIVDSDHLIVFDITNENESLLLQKTNVGNGIETIFPFDNMLFLGTQSGVLIFDISNASSPTYISQYNHIVACDPVVTDGEYAFLTLRTGTNCGRPINELQVLDLSNINNPQWINSVSMVNPKGLALNQNILYVCDDGVKIFDVSDKYNIQLIEHIRDIPANDVIFHNNQLLVTADNGFYQFDASDFVQLSHYTYQL